MTRHIHQKSLCTNAVAILFFLCLLGTPQPPAIARATSPNYPEKGKVVAVRVDEHTDYVPVSPPDSKGRTHGGQAFVYRKQVYRVETYNGVYELQGGKNPTMAVGDAVEFAIVKGTARLRVGDEAGEKEKKYRIISTAPKPDSP